MNKPKAYHVRRPTDLNQQNGQIINPPRMPEIGGADSLGKGIKKNKFKIVNPGKRG